MTIYQNMFRGIQYKFKGEQAYASLDGGATWEKSGVSEELIKRLPYYKVSQK